MKKQSVIQTQTEKPDIVSQIILFLFLITDLIPHGESIDSIGPQWFYLGCVNILVLAYFILRKVSVDRKSFLNPVFSSYIGFVFVAGLSIFWAINSVEAIVCYSRIIITAFTLCNIILLKPDIKLFRFICTVTAIAALLQCIQALNIFFTRVSLVGLSQSILDMRAESGSKNILAAALVVKIPFVIFNIHTGLRWKKLFNCLILFVVTYTIWILNARSAYLGISIIAVTYLLFVFTYVGEKSFQRSTLSAGSVLLPVILSFVVSIFTVNQFRDVTAVEEYSDAAARISSISFTNKASSNRFSIWNNAKNIIEDKPLTGVGIGNFKIASIPYEKYKNADYIFLHTHNDFLETTADTGLIGGAFYLLSFLLAAFFSVKNLTDKKIHNEKRFVLFISFLGLAGYSVDAFLNFPMERTGMQLYWAVLFGVNIICNFSAHQSSSPNKFNIRFGLIAVGTLLIAATYFADRTARSMRMQGLTYNDQDSPNPIYKWDDIKDEFPTIPNLTIFGSPVDAIRARYLLFAERPDEAMPYIEKAIQANPYLMYGERLKSSVYAEKGMYDSAFYFSKKAFEARPLNFPFFKSVLNFAVIKNDSAYVEAAFQQFKKYAVNGIGWATYLSALRALNKSGDKISHELQLGLKTFPNDSSLTAFKSEWENTVTKKNSIGTNQPASPVVLSLFQEGAKHYSEHRYKEAAAAFVRAAVLQPNYHPALENAGLSYYALDDFANALRYFKTVADNNWTNDGKSELFTGICMVNTGRAKESCQYFKLADRKGYYDAPRLMKLYCK